MQICLAITLKIMLARSVVLGLLATSDRPWARVAMRVINRKMKGLGNEVTGSHRLVDRGSHVRRQKRAASDNELGTVLPSEGPCLY
jgi:hypothetical protein